ncbi:hypothetical protein [Thermococcus sp.]|uniref:hypothetical protein n=1 Tax=Thermococcus sp. TaxID=35749 RepID=UPI0025D0AAB0|nr:hypothetical protein [Thermococcus sp.]
MKKKALAVFVLFLIVAAPTVGAWSLKDLLKGTASHALDLFTREVMPVDGYKGLKVGEGFWIEGEHFWNPDYYVQLNDSRVYWSYLVPTDVDVKVQVWKVYLGIFAFPYATYDDIWWKKEKVGDGWIGAFFVWDFSWRPGHGWRPAGKAYIAYNLPSAQDLNVKNVTILQNGSVQVLFNDNTTKLLSFEEFEGFGNMTVENVTFRHLVGNLYLVKRG